MKIVINDANILIDLVELGLLNEFFALGFEFRTNDTILAELYEYQKIALKPAIDSEKLIVEVLDECELKEAASLAGSMSGLSLQDCTAFVQAARHNATLLTSDNKLRKYCLARKTETHGHLWIFDLLVEQRIITAITAIEKLDELIVQVNPKLGLPEKECRKYEVKWKSTEV